MCILHVGHRCRPSIIIGRTWDDVRAKVRKQRKKKECESGQKSREGSIVADQVETSHNLQMSRCSHGRGEHTQQEQTTVPEMDFAEILQNTAHRRKRVQLVSNNSPQVQLTHDRMPRRYCSVPRNDFVDSSGITTDTVVWEYMCNVGKNLADTALLKIISHFDGRARTQELNRSKNNLEELINEGTNDPMILKLWKTTLEAKMKQLVEHQGVVPGTPESSDDENEEDDGHNYTFCALQPQRTFSTVLPNKRTNHNFYRSYPTTQQIFPQKLITSVKPNRNFWSSNRRGDSTQQHQININGNIVNIGYDTSQKGLEIKQSYMENEAFLSKYSYGGGKKKKKKSDSDADYDPMGAKKRKENKRIRKKIEEEKKVIKGP